MKSFTPTQITRDHLLSVEIGEECSFIVPCNIPKSILLDENETDAFILSLSPLQTQDEFFIAEECYTNDNVNFDYGIPSRVDKHVYPYCVNYNRYKTKLDTSQMTPEQSRFHGVVVGVSVKKLNLSYENKLSKVVDYRILVARHNELYNTNIEPSLEDYVFYLTVKRLR